MHYVRFLLRYQVGMNPNLVGVVLELWQLTREYTMVYTYRKEGIQGSSRTRIPMGIRVKSGQQFYLFNSADTVEAQRL
jgi:hypothetical protein